jgi:hypothetical protein
MTRRQQALILLFGLALLFAGVASRADAQFPPSRFFGGATLEGRNAAGATLIALINGINCGSTTVDVTGRFQLDVLTASQRQGCGAPGVTIAFTVNGAYATQTASWEAGGINQINLTASPTTPPPVTPTPTPIPTAVGTPVALNISPNGATAGGVTSQTLTPQWLDRPPTASGAQNKTCPNGNSWSFLYWGGPNETPIANAAAVCPAADVFWTFRNRKWLGYATRSSAASDTWSVQIGDANFIKGR